MHSLKFGPLWLMRRVCAVLRMRMWNWSTCAQDSLCAKWHCDIFRLAVRQKPTTKFMNHIFCWLLVLRLSCSRFWIRPSSKFGRLFHASAIKICFYTLMLGSGVSASLRCSKITVLYSKVRYMRQQSPSARTWEMNSFVPDQHCSIVELAKRIMWHFHIKFYQTTLPERNNDQNAKLQSDVMVLFLGWLC